MAPGQPSGWERAARKEGVGEPITVHVLTAHPLYRQPRRRERGRSALSARRGRGDEWAARARPGLRYHGPRVTLRGRAGNCEQRLLTAGDWPLPSELRRHGMPSPLGHSLAHSRSQETQIIMITTFTFRGENRHNQVQKWIGLPSTRHSIQLQRNSKYFF